MGIADVETARCDEASRYFVLGSRDHVDCVFCGDPIDGVFVYWSFAGGPIVQFHPNCAGEFATVLTVDSAHAHRALLGKPINAGVGVPHSVYGGNLKDDGILQPRPGLRPVAGK